MSDSTPVKITLQTGDHALQTETQTAVVAFISGDAVHIYIHGFNSDVNLVASSMMKRLIEEGIMPGAIL